eukprot:644973-Amphidinium_carterae.1
MFSLSCRIASEMLPHSSLVGTRIPIGLAFAWSGRKQSSALIIAFHGNPSFPGSSLGWFTVHRE